jgi:hypothetical protein
MSIQKMTISPSKKSVAVDLLAMIYKYTVGARMSFGFSCSGGINPNEANPERLSRGWAGG